MRKTNHEQTLVKVNAPVDTRMVPVIEALSLNPNIVTQFSCENQYHTQPEEEQVAYVLFNYKSLQNPTRDLAEVVDLIIESLQGVSKCSFRIDCNRFITRCKFEFPTDKIDIVAERIREVFNEDS